MIIIDIETSGTDVRTHGLVSIGALEFDNPDNTFYGECYLEDSHDIDPEALPVIGFTEEQLRDQSRQSPYILLKSFVEWLENISDRTPAGLHVGGFDLLFLQRTADELGLNWPLGKRSIDLHSLMFFHLKKYYPEKYEVKNQRSNIYGNLIQKYCGLPSVTRPHNALADARWEAECFSRLLYASNLLEDFEDYPIPNYLK
jgi:DNA polymerase III epsilon subunit-like protein